MRHLLKRHAIPISAHLDYSLVLAFAVPADRLAPLLVPGLALDTYEGYGFFVIAVVKTRGLRPQFLPPPFGTDFFLSGYRVFVRYTTREGRTLRGLRIVRSDTNSALMQRLGNALTHYNYVRSTWTVERTPDRLSVAIATPKGLADLDVVADLSRDATEPPPGSPFPDLKIARRFAGPMPFTFDYEPQTHSSIRVEGVRTAWHPRPIHVDVRRAAFLDNFVSGGDAPILANAFFLEDVPYRWKRGVRERL